MNNYISALHKLAQDAIRNSADQAGEARGIEKAAKLYFQMSNQSAVADSPEPGFAIPQITSTIREKKIPRIERAKEERRVLKKRIADVVRAGDWIEDAEIVRLTGLSLSDVLRVMRAACLEEEVMNLGRKYKPSEEFFK